MFSVNVTFLANSKKKMSNNVWCATHFSGNHHWIALKNTCLMEQPCAEALKAKNTLSTNRLLWSQKKKHSEQRAIRSNALDPLRNSRQFSSLSFQRRLQQRTFAALRENPTIRGSLDFRHLKKHGAWRFPNITLGNYSTKGRERAGRRGYLRETFLICVLLTGNPGGPWIPASPSVPLSPGMPCGPISPLGPESEFAGRELPLRRLKPKLD